MRLNIFFSLIVLSLFIAACTSSTGPGEPLNLEGSFSTQPVTTNQVFNLQQHTNDIFAATDGGLLQIDLSGQAQLERLFFDTASVKTMLILENDFWLASVFFTGGEGDNLFKSIDQGRTWSPFRNGYGGERQLTPTTMDGYISTGDTILFARVGGLGNVGRSLDGGQSWQSVWESWENPTLATSLFVTVHSNRRAEVWAGGATALFVPFLIKSTDGGNTWTPLTVIENVETTVYDIATHHRKSNKVMAGLGIGIRKSTDSGKSWSTSYNETAIFSLAHSASNPEVIYASGINSEGTLFFAASADFGNSWETAKMEDGPTGLRVNDMVSVMQDGREVLYLGTDQGLYSYTFAE